MELIDLTPHVLIVGPGKRGHIVAHDVSWAAQTGKHLLRTQNVSEQNQKHFLCPATNVVRSGKRETFVSATMCPRQCLLVWHGLYRLVRHASEIWPGSLCQLSVLERRYFQ